MEAKLSIDMWQLIVGIVTVGVWMVRLEGRTNFLEQRLNKQEIENDETRVKVETLDSKVFTELARIRESLARLEGALGVTKKEN